MADQQRTRNREVDPRTILALLGRREIDDLLARLNCMAAIPERSGDSIAGFIERPAGQADDGETGKAEADIGFDGDDESLDAEETCRM